MPQPYPSKNSNDQTVKTWRNEGPSKWAPGAKEAKKSGLLEGIMDMFTQMAFNDVHTKATFKGHKKAVTQLCASTDNLHFFSASGDNTMRMWHRPSQQCMMTFNLDRGPIQAIGVIPNQRSHCYTYVSKDPMDNPGKGTIYFWNFMGNYPMGQIEDVSNRFAFSTQGERIAYANMGTHHIHVCTYHGQQSHSVQLKGHTSPVTQILFSTDNQFVIASAQDGTIRLWDVESCQQLCDFVGHTAEVTTMSMSPGGRWIASASKDGTIRIWDTYIGTNLITLQEGLGKNQSITPYWTDHDRYFVTLEASQIKVWDLSQQVCLKTFRMSGQKFEHVQIFEGGQKALIVCQDSPSVLWVDLMQADVIEEFGPLKCQINDILYDSHSNEFLIAGSDHHITAWGLND